MAEDYIKRKDALQAVIDCWEPWFGSKPAGDIVRCPYFAINKIPSADVVEVVRCKDCIHRPLHIDGERPDSPYIDDDCCYKDYTCPYLCDDDYYSRMPDDDWFCNHGERMDGGT